MLALVGAPLLGFDRAPAAPARLTFTGHYDGRGAEGIDEIWRGALDAPEAGVIVVRLDRRLPSEVRGFVFVSHDNVARSFGADLAGGVDGSGAVHLIGVIDVGAAAGSTIDVAMRLDGQRLPCRGTIRFRPLTPPAS
jgi:hypothetical protein